MIISNGERNDSFNLIASVRASGSTVHAPGSGQRLTRAEAGPAGLCPCFDFRNGGRSRLLRRHRHPARGPPLWRAVPRHRAPFQRHVHCSGTDALPLHGQGSPTSAAAGARCARFAAHCDPSRSVPNCTQQEHLQFFMSKNTKFRDLMLERVDAADRRRRMSLQDHTKRSQGCVLTVSVPEKETTESSVTARSVPCCTPAAATVTHASPPESQTRTGCSNSTNTAS